MKARIQKSVRPSVWLYQPEKGADQEEYRKAVSIAAGENSTDFHTFGPEKSGLKIREILAPESAEKQADAEAVPTDPVLLMNGFSSKELDRFLASLRGRCAERGLPGINLKAVITPVNSGWIFSELVRELQSEHRLMHGKD